MLHHGDVALGRLLLEHLGLVFGIGLTGVVDHPDGLELRIDLTGQVELLAHRVGADRAHHIGAVLADAAGGGTGTGTPGIGAVAEDHRRGFRGHLHGGLQGRGAHRQDHVHLVTHKLLHHQGGVGQLTGRILLNEVGSFARGVAGLCQGRFKALAGVVRWRRIQHLQHADGGPLHPGVAAKFSAGREHHRADSACPYQAEKFTTLETHQGHWKTAAPLWPCRTSPAMQADRELHAPQRSSPRSGDPRGASPAGRRGRGPGRGCG